MIERSSIGTGILQRVAMTRGTLLHASWDGWLFTHDHAHLW